MADPDPTPTLTSPLCAGQDFERQHERSEGRWGFTTHVMTLMICTRLLSFSSIARDVRYPPTRASG